MGCLSDVQKQHVEDQGSFKVEDQIPPEMLQKIRDEITRFEADAATMTASNDRLDLEDSHTPDKPRAFDTIPTKETTT